MPTDIKPFTKFLQSLGAPETAHSGHGLYAHLTAVYRDLKKWGCDEDLCVAGLFHSIYGTEKFAPITLAIDRRAELRDLIGARAERLAYLNCAMDRPRFDALIAAEGMPVLYDRFTGAQVALTDAELGDLCTLQVCDWLEQVGRSEEWDYRRAAYRQMAKRLGDPALSAYTEVFAAGAAG